ncbi:Uncharacterised protein [Legionella birminghamensis]|uniref:Uncharacterized protein n=1 Tax=Legionella birminghamensis TaxID=28083 RepID=A0A378IKG2_9GAMM|nr:Uncharacterised protein [Legionella birminghamensis]
MKTYSTKTRTLVLHGLSKIGNLILKAIATFASDSRSKPAYYNKKK